ALEGWKQNCRAYHNHPPGFVDGTPYLSPPRPETPPSITPPPSCYNTEHLMGPDSSQHQHAPQYSMHRPVNHSSNDSHVRYWAIHSPDFVGVVSSTNQAQAILDDATERNNVISLRLVTDLVEAEEWLRSQD
ncbi:hypothetical protein EV361DRAFT_874029, partial [Lentinula raphanica]